MKRGAATLYIVVGLTVFLGVMTYIFVQTSNLEIDILTYFKNIQKEYEENTSGPEKQKIYEQLEAHIEALEITNTEETEENE